ncbi:universal stress protein [Microbulbifer sp. SAOS-129_SWC]|uniref:universal stress protein n=1 Tax=Microbulbifer sp. SAOS-129_SWC TaxID=3145235 RepID=UPI003216B206
MQNFHKILFVSHGAGDESDGLMQAVSTARNSGAELQVQIACPPLPDEFEGYREAYVDGLRGHVEATLTIVRDNLRLAQDELPVAMAVDCGKNPAERITRRVLDEDFDLVIKNVEGADQGRGFRALDMELLRKCPCPVWLCRPIRHSRPDINVVVAVDPECEGGAAYDLAIRLLRLSRALADTCSGTLHVVSCWEYDVDSYLRQHVSIEASDEEIDRIIERAGSRHRGQLDALIHAAGIGGPVEIHHAVARAERFIPLLIEERGFDILVMGTVARSGIPGFIMGNTAENILRKVSCSLLALKPSDFVSPVKP